MAGKSSSLRKTHANDGADIRFVFHESFTEPCSAQRLDPAQLLERDIQHETSYMPDDLTRECARRMHYAAYRYANESDPRVADEWKQKYYRLRDLIILGNQKLVYRAVQKFTALSNQSDDCIGDGFLILINAVAAYNPWMGIRFSTYAFTCLMRWLTRAARKAASDFLVYSLTLDLNADPTVDDSSSADESENRSKWIFQYLQDDHPLLTDREKHVISRRFQMSEKSKGSTLHEIGQDLGVSKERVRQVQIAALAKLREELRGVVGLN